MRKHFNKTYREFQFDLFLMMLVVANHIDWITDIVHHLASGTRPRTDRLLAGIDLVLVAGSGRFDQTRSFLLSLIRNAIKLNNKYHA